MDPPISNLITKIGIKDKDENVLHKRSDINKIFLKQDSNSSLTSISSSTTGLRKSVSFHEIEIKEFPMELGDNPSACGIPIQIGWEPQHTSVLTLNEYENKMRHMRRVKSDMLIPTIRKLDIVEKSGATMRQVRRIIKEKEKLQNSRDKSIKAMKWDRVNEKIESVQRKLRNVASWTQLHSQATSACELDSHKQKLHNGGRRQKFGSNVRSWTSWCAATSSEITGDSLDDSRFGSLYNLSDLCFTKDSSAIDGSTFMYKTVETRGLGMGKDNGPLCF